MQVGLTSIGSAANSSSCRPSTTLKVGSALSGATWARDGGRDEEQGGEEEQRPRSHGGAGSVREGRRAGGFDEIEYRGAARRLPGVSRGETDLFEGLNAEVGFVRRRRRGPSAPDRVRLLVFGWIGRPRSAFAALARGARHRRPGLAATPHRPGGRFVPGAAQRRPARAFTARRRGSWQNSPPGCGGCHAAHGPPPPVNACSANEIRLNLIRMGRVSARRRATAPTTGRRLSARGTLAAKHWRHPGLAARTVAATSPRHSVGTTKEFSSKVSSSLIRSG